MPEANDPWASLADNLGAVPAPDQAAAQPTPAPQPAPPRAVETRRPEPKKPAPQTSGGDWTDIVSGLGLQPDAVPLRPAAPPPPPAARERAPSPPPESFERRPEGQRRTERPERLPEGEPSPRDLPPRDVGANRGVDDLSFQDRPVVDRGSSDRPVASRRDDDGRRDGRRDGGQSSGRGRRGDGRRGEGSPQGEARGTAGDRPSAERPADARTDQPRPDSLRSSGRGDAAPPSPRSEERAPSRREEDDLIADGDSSEGRILEDGDRPEGDRTSGEPRRGRRRRGRRGGRGRGGRDRDDAPRDEAAPGRADDAAPRSAPQADDSADDEFGFQPRKPAEEAPRQERRPAPQRRQDDGERRSSRDRDGEPRSQPPRGEPSAPAAGFDWDAPGERASAPSRSPSSDRSPPRKTERDDDNWGGIDLDPREPASETGGGRDGAPIDGEPSGDAGDAGDEQTRRRRRRGRRGGRRRGGRERTGDERPTSEQAGDESAPVSRGDNAADDEPLPSGYGRAPVPPRPAANGTGEGEARGRRRRGRGDRKSSTPRAAGAAGAAGQPAAEGAEPKVRGRSSRRGTAGRSRRPEPELRATSRLARGRRDDFAPVAGGYDEDDEGLDFLGIEEAGRETPQVESRRSDDDELLAESGLSSVTDVPSWVEAIGIVIAGNLDARNRPPRGGDDQDRGRRDGSRGARG